MSKFVCSDCQANPCDADCPWRTGRPPVVAPAPQPRCEWGAVDCRVVHATREPVPVPPGGDEELVRAMSEAFEEKFEAYGSLAGLRAALRVVREHDARREEARVREMLAKVQAEFMGRK